MRPTLLFVLFLLFLLFAGVTYLLWLVPVIIKHMGRIADRLGEIAEHLRSLAASKS